MRTEKRLLVLGLVALLSACSQPAGVSPSVTGVGGVDAPRFELLRAPQDQVTALEDAILAKVNAVRAAHGLHALAHSDVLRQMAIKHIRDMQTRRYFGHNTPDGLSPYNRMKNANIPFSATGETISHPHVGGNTAQVVIDDWLRHPGGKSQLLDARFTQIGVAVVKSGPREYLVTAEYRRP